MTAVIQSSTATIVITAGLVAAGVLKVRQSVGIIFGANVGTTVTGQIIRLIDINSECSASWLNIFKPSALAPIALVIGVVLFIFLKFKNSDKTGAILIGFGILFSGLNSMSLVVSSIDKSFFEQIFTSFGDNPFLGYAAGAGVAFILQSSSATIGILQTLSQSGALSFSAITPIIVGVYLGDSVTTAIVCFIGTKADAKRVAVTNLIFNLLKTFLVIAGVLIAFYTHLLDQLWNMTVNAGIIANTNSIFNVASALILLPFGGLMVKLACRIVKDDRVKRGKYDDKLDALSPVFFATPALAFKSCYEALLAMFNASKTNIQKAIGLLDTFDAGIAREIEEEDCVDQIAGRVSNYLVQLSPHISSDLHVRILDEYYKVVTEFERLSDHAMNIKEVAAELHDNNSAFSDDAKQEIAVLTDAIYRILDLSQAAFEKCDETSANHIEPLEEVVDDLVNALKENHLARLRAGRCNVYMDTGFSNLMSDLERISDVCSNIGVATVVRTETKLEINSHDYISKLHSGRDEEFNTEYTRAHAEFFGKLGKLKPPGEAAEEPAASDVD